MNNSPPEPTTPEQWEWLDSRDAHLNTDPAREPDDTRAIPEAGTCESMLDDIIKMAA